MPAAKYMVDLQAEERASLRQLIRRGQPAARQGTRARLLLNADEGLTDEQIAAALPVGRATVGRVRQRFVEEGLERALTERPRPGQRRKLTGKQAAQVIALACSQAPEGRERWTLRVLADPIVERGWVSSLSYETVRQTLKKMNLSPGRSNTGVSQQSGRNLSPPWRMSWSWTRSRTIRSAPKSTLMRQVSR
jgi:transposase